MFLMRAETVSIGTELLLGQTVDSNAAELGKAFALAGIDHFHRQTVGDNLPRVVEALCLALARSDIVVTVGGLGPTEDDLTREAIAEALDDCLVQDDGALEHLKGLFQSRGLAWTGAQTKQALRPTCAATLPNPNGTAPGLACRKNDKTVFALPGPPGEFVPMLYNHVLPSLVESGGGSSLHTRVIRIVGMGESMVEQTLAAMMSQSDPTVAPYAKTGEVHLRLATKASSAEAACSRLDPLESMIRQKLGDVVYGVGDETLESVVLSMLRHRSMTLSTAESCTGGMVGQRLTSVAGSSDVYLGGVVSYANNLKTSLLSVSEETLAQDGAVSEECARQMAIGCRALTGADVAVSVTGVAGPGGGTNEKPIGLVFLAVADADGCHIEQNLFMGSRKLVRERSTIRALALVRNRLLATS